MEIEFKGKKVLVTGAGKGLGRDFSKALAKCGAEVCALSRTQADLDSLAQEVPGLRTICVDIGDWKATKKAVEEAGHFDLLVNNAAISATLPFLEVTEENLDMHLNINLKSIFNISQVVAKSMIAKGTGGSIVNVSSCASQNALPNHSVYSTVKAGVDMLTKSMCLELGKHKIRVNTVNPTVVLTPMGIFHWGNNPERSKPLLDRIPLGKFVEIEDVTNAVLYLLSDKAAMVNGHCLAIDGGLSI